MWGLWGRPRLRPGRRRSGQPRQRGHRLRRQAVPLGSAYALAARRSGPAGLALSLVTRSAPSRPAGARPPCGRLAHCAAQAPLVRLAPLRGSAIKTAARTGGASAAVLALRARRGAGERRLRAGYAGRSAGRQGQGKRRAGGSAAPAAALPAGIPASKSQPWRVSRPVRASRPFSFW